MNRKEKAELHQLTQRLLDNHHGKRWLELLGKRFHQEGSTAKAVWPWGRIDTNLAMKQEGQRSVVVGIKNLLKKPLKKDDDQ
jgi:hypothetical protein